MADTDKKKEDEEEELVAVGEGLEEKPEERKDEDLEEKDPKDKEDLEDDEEEEGEEERLGAGEDEDDDKKAKRKVERKTRRERQRAARDRDKKELGFLQTRNEQLETRFSELDARVGHSETAQIDGRIVDIKSKIQLADQVISKAVSQNDGEAMVEAQGIRDNLRDSLNQLNYAKQTMAQRPAQELPDPRLIGHASAWMEDHDWWNPDGTDPDSRQVSRIDAALVAEGKDPLTSEYWDELSRRVEAAIPERFENGEDTDTGARRKKKVKKKAGGPTFRTGGRERPLKKNEVYISPERKEAMIEAGVWEDPELRQKYLKSYARFDREAQSNA